MVKITAVEERSRAARAGIAAGDRLVAVNQNEITDVLDYRFYLAERKVVLSLLRPDGTPYEAVIRKGEYDDVGLDFETPLMDEKHACKNGCIFCFIDQNPKGLRDSLYFKDDDSRLSFLHGNYITLTNLTDRDVARIVKMRFSPINISVHTTNPELRVKMMKNKRSGEVLRYLWDFKRAGLSICGQIVLCRGINDGAELLRTMRDLSELFPELSSVSIVPAGLTKFRDKLYPLTDFSPDEAAAVIDMVDAFAEDFKRTHGSRLFFVADEMYLKAGRRLPDAGYYEGYPQLENGVGMIRSFSEDFAMGLEDACDMEELRQKIRQKGRVVSTACGHAAYPTISDLCGKLERIFPGLQIKVYKITNYFFGESITVSGLMTGRDLSEQLKGQPLGDELLLPENCLRRDEDVFLCGMTLEELSEKLSVPIRKVADDGYELVRALLGEEAE